MRLWGSLARCMSDAQARRLVTVHAKQKQCSMGNALVKSNVNARQKWFYLAWGTCIWFFIKCWSLLVKAMVHKDFDKV